MIRNYTTNKKGKKEVDEREREKLIALFQKGEERWRKKEGTARGMLNRDEKVESLLLKVQQ